MKNGEIKKYRKDGSVWKVSNYINNKLNGDWITYNEDGTIDEYRLYENNKIVRIITSTIIRRKEEYGY